MPNPEEKIKKLQELLKLLDESLTRKEFEAAFKAVLDQLALLEKTILKRIDGKTEEAEKRLEELQKLHEEVIRKIEEENTFTLSNIKKWAAEQVNALFIKYQIKEKIAEIDEKLANVKDGKDADSEEIIGKVLAKIPKSEETADTILDKITGLIEIKDISGLEKEIEELKKIRTERRLFGGGFSTLALNAHILDPYTPTGTINGVNKDFVLSHTPSPSTSLKVFRGGQLLSLTEDYTLNSTTITFLVAPIVGEILKVDHRI